MNGYIPVLDQCPPKGWICNATWKCTGPSEVHGHTPPRTMIIDCPCVVCRAELPGLDLDRFVLGSPWIASPEHRAKTASYVGIYDRNAIENK